jgi:hypothetical protein
MHADPQPESTTTPREETLAALASDLAAAGGQLLHEHLKLLDAEAREELRRLKSAAELTGTGLVALTVGTLFLLIGVVRVLQEWARLPESTAWLLVGGVSAAGGLSAYLAGRRRLAGASVLPHRTLASLNEGWQALMSRIRRA